MADGASRWVDLPLEIAKRHPYYGVGGWLWLVAFGSIFGAARIVISIGPVYSNIDFGALPPELFGLIAVEFVLNVVMVLWALANLALLFSMHRLFPMSFVGFMAASAAVVSLDPAISKFALDAIGRPVSWDEALDKQTVRDIGRTIVGACIWIPYAFVSRRVNVTYRHRVRASDPTLGRSTADVF